MIWSWTQMLFGPGLKCDSVLDLNVIQSRPDTNQCGYVPDPNAIRSWTQMQFGPGSKCEMVLGPKAIWSWP